MTVSATGIEGVEVEGIDGIDGVGADVVRDEEPAARAEI